MGLMVEGRQVDIRVVTLPIVHGESVVMRILDKSNVTISLDALGMREHDRQRFQKAIGQSHGAVLVTGPTGSGKTTTLYAALGELNTPDKTLITIEDPVEYQLAGVKQIQVNGEGGPHLRHRPALDAPLRPERDHGRRDPRPRHRPDRGGVRPHRPPRALDAAHERRAERDHAPDRDGHRALPGGVVGRVRRGAAPRADALHGLPRGGRALAGDAARERLQGHRGASRASSPRAAAAAAAPATRAASASTRPCR